MKTEPELEHEKYQTPEEIARDDYYKSVIIEVFDLLLCSTFSGHRVLRRSHGPTINSYKNTAINVKDEKIISIGEFNYHGYTSIRSMHKAFIIKNFGNITIEEFEEKYPEWTI